MRSKMTVAVREGHGGVNNSDEEGGWGGISFEMEKEEFSFIIIKLKAITWHPASNVREAGLKSLQGLLLGLGAQGVIT